MLWKTAVGIVQKTEAMFFKKKRVFVLPAWLVWVDEAQKKYARKLADWLGRKVEKVSTKRLRVYVVLFLIGMAGVNLVLVWHSLQDHKVRSIDSPVVVPARVIIDMPRPVVWVDPKRMLDSLRRDSVGARVFDSLMKARPGLRDTLKALGDLN